MSTSFANDRDFGSVSNSQHLSSALDFYTLNSLCPLSTDDFSAMDAGQNLIRVGEIIGIQAQPVMTNLLVATGVDLTATANKTMYGITDSTNTSATIYVLKFSIEHTGAWINTDVTGTLAGTLAYALVNETALAQLPYGTPNQFILVSTGANTQTASLMVSAILPAGGNRSDTYLV
jgi:hypothetical protein